MIQAPIWHRAWKTKTRNCALDRLSPDQRAVIELTFYHGLSYPDIAKILNCPENTVKTRMFHARKKLQAIAVMQEN